MIPLAIVIVWAGYGVGSYGWVLIKGWNITPRQWWSPLNPLQWPASGAAIPTVPKGHVWPTSLGTNEGGGGSAASV